MSSAATAIPAVALAIPAVVVGGDAGNISVMALAVMSAVEGGEIPAVASAIPTAAVGGYEGKIPTVALATYVAVDAVAIPAVAVVGDAGSESIAVEDNTINGMMPTMM